MVYFCTYFRHHMSNKQGATLTAQLSDDPRKATTHESWIGLSAHAEEVALCYIHSSGSRPWIGDT
jgi:hypothetical protein